ncbi:MAG: dihydrodipicolinate synthase family protein [Cyclobacteriaceae bacterium]
MNVTERLNGIIGVINTPFGNDDAIDYDSLGNYINHSIACDVTGFLALGMAAEIDKLTINEKELIVKTVVNEVDGRVPVICGVSSKTQSERIFLTEKFINLGCDGIMVNISFDNDDVFNNQIHEIAELNPQILMIQDWDSKEYGIPVSVITSLFKEIDCFKCLKIEVVPAGFKYTEVLEATDNKLHVSGGWAGSQMIEALDRGVNAFMPTILHDVYQKVFRLHRSGKREEAKKIFYQLVPILAFSHQHLDISVHFNKKLVHSQGIFSTDIVRQPILEFDKYHATVADELIEKAIKLTKKI